MVTPNKRRADELKNIMDILNSNPCNNRSEARLAIKATMAGTYMAGQNVSGHFVPFPSLNNGVLKASEIDVNAINEFINAVGSSADSLLTELADEWFLKYDEPPSL
ncbi:hypothetical protein IMF22_12225 [Pseudomonas poae]|uniref:Uncharacterized protein n=1 Tax=Pseudomonas poae TaxID=200451 RepID=A0A7M1KN73_9PSED|nr:hypothetical protein [Pseudomonas poae]QOQ77737.1 hypothetical protein IMF22_12225 [Pseudomonas poae]